MSCAIKWPSERIGTRAVQKVTQPGSWRFYPPLLQKKEIMENNLRGKKKDGGGLVSERSALLIKDSMRHLSCIFFFLCTSAEEHITGV